MATLIDTRIVGRPLWLVDRDQPGRGVEIHVKRLEIASEDCEAEWCRLFGVTDSAGWPPVTTEPSRANPGGTGEGTAPVEMVLGLVADRLHLLDGRDAADVAEDLLAGDLEELAAVSSWCALITPCDGRRTRCIGVGGPSAPRNRTGAGAGVTTVGPGVGGGVRSGLGATSIPPEPVNGRRRG